MTTGQAQRDRSPYVSDDDLHKIIVDGDARILVEAAERLGEKLAKNENLTTSQVRNIFGTVRQIQAEAMASTVEQEEHAGTAEIDRSKLPPGAARRLLLLLPYMAYQAKRERSTAQLVNVLTPAIKLVNDDVLRFQRFVEFFEATLAYHKAYGGSDK